MKLFVQPASCHFRILRACARTTIAVIVLIEATVVNASAQSVFSSQGEVSPADAANKLLQSPTPSGDTGLTNELATPSDQSETLQTLPGGTTLEQAMIKVGKLGLINCTNKKIRVRTYNTADIVYAIPFQDKVISPGGYEDLNCASSKCKVQISNGKPSTPIGGGYKFDGGLQRLGNTVSCN
ncbi:MAG: hypothetical protein ACK4HL_11330 [Aestuariivirga sp.]